MSYDDIVEEALCFGWVDRQPRRLDDAQAMLYIAPRAPNSNWSRATKDRVSKLRAAGLMSAGGEAVIAAARATGTWTALEDVENLIEPDDPHAAAADDPQARERWAAFPRSARRAIVEWLAAAKRPETRRKRLGMIVTEAAAGRRANQWRQPKAR